MAENVNPDPAEAAGVDTAAIRARCDAYNAIREEAQVRWLIWVNFRTVLAQRFAHPRALGYEANTTLPRNLYRLLARKLHPDMGGEREAWDRLDQARQLLDLTSG